MSEWKPINTAPHGRALLVAYKNSLDNWRIVKAEYIQRWTVETTECEFSNHEFNDEYHEEDGVYYIREGWYEMLDNWDEYASVVIVEGDPVAWHPLPKVTPELETLYLASLGGNHEQG